MHASARAARSQPSSSSQVRRMKEARAAGWFVKVLYVRVPVKTAIDRAMLRTRRVSPERIAMYQAKISKALVIAAKVRDQPRARRLPPPPVGSSPRGEPSAHSRAQLPDTVARPDAPRACHCASHARSASGGCAHLVTKTRSQPTSPPRALAARGRGGDRRLIGRFAAAADPLPDRREPVGGHLTRGALSRSAIRGALVKERGRGADRRVVDDEGMACMLVEAHFGWYDYSSHVRRASCHVCVGVVRERVCCTKVGRCCTFAHSFLLVVLYHAKKRLPRAAFRCLSAVLMHAATCLITPSHVALHHPSARQWSSAS